MNEKRIFRRAYGSATNLQLVVSASAKTDPSAQLRSGAIRVIRARVNFSASVAAKLIECNIDCDLGASYDTTRFSQSFTGQEFVWTPQDDCILFPGDEFDLVVAAAGAGVTAYAGVEFEVLP